MHHMTWFVLFCRDLPDFLDANAVVLRRAALVECEVPDHSLAEMTTTTFGKHCVTRAQLITRRVVGTGLTILAYAQVAGSDSTDTASFVVQQIESAEASENLDAQRFSLLTQPAAQVREADDIVALVVRL